MPKNQIKSSSRAKASIAAVMSISTMIGGAYYVVRPNQEPVPAAIVLASGTLVQPWEGRELRAYYDRIAKPAVWTICDGDTENVKAGMVETPAGCDKRLQKRLTKDFYPGLKKCIASFDKKPVSWQAVMTSLSYNVGIGAACGSTAARLGRAGQYQSSCLAATAFNKAGGKMIIGLVKRREMGDAQRIGEAELCVSGLN
ncbi:MAG: glycoside hydrolase [Mesorhizobium sp.]|nr:MAG: glycoside hydrolase [Mesorhizobium sp.]